MTQQFIVTSDLKDEDLYKDLEKYAKDNTRSISFVVLTCFSSRLLFLFLHI